MYNLSPVGKYFIQICTTTPCMIRGAYKLVDVCKKNINRDANQHDSSKTKDGYYTVPKILD